MLTRVPEGRVYLRVSRGGRSTHPDSGLGAPDRIGRLFDGLAGLPALLIAVSGGPDSMALLGLAARWSGARGAGAPRLHVATVDHGLRAESADEVRLVADVSAGLGLPHACLAWVGPKPTTRLQERARTSRYSLLVDHARAVGAGHVLTAHHADDQAETVLMRLGRGSGVGGLAGMRRETSLAPGIRLVRPLLEVRKADLVAFCHANDLPFVDDPSNADTRYARGRLRADAAERAALGLNTPTMAKLGRRMARAEDALEAEADRVTTLLAPCRDGGALHVRLAPGRDIAPEILVRLLGRWVSPGTKRVRLDRLEDLADAIAAACAEGQILRKTLAGACIALAADGALTVTPEPPRRRGLPRGLEDGTAGVKADLARSFASLGK